MLLMNFGCSLFQKHIHDEVFFWRLFFSKGQQSSVWKRTKLLLQVTLACSFSTQGLKISYSAQTMKLMSFICQVEWKVWMFKKHLLKGYGLFALLMEENYCLELQSVYGEEAVLLIQCCERINSKIVEKIGSTFVINWFVWSLSNHLSLHL